MQAAAQLAVAAQLDVDALVEAQPYQVQRLLDGGGILLGHQARGAGGRRRPEPPRPSCAGAAARSGLDACGSQTEKPRLVRLSWDSRLRRPK